MITEAKIILNKYFGYENFRKGQEETVLSILQNKDTLCIMPTGGGKSICYQVPALCFEGITIVISPLVSLMKDQVDTLRQAGINAAFINSTLTYPQIIKAMQNTAEGKYKIIYVAPERLDSEEFLSVIRRVDISLIAIDEAHCISSWGHDFRPSYLNIQNFISILNQKPVVLALTATATKFVKNDICNLLNIDNIHSTGFERENLSFSVLRGEGSDFVVNYVKNNIDEAGIVYAATRKDVEEICSILKREGIKTSKYHAGLSNEERKKSQEAFLYDEVNVIVATVAFGMGIDKSNVRYVIHYQMPKNIESYYQEAGRAGRDGLPSKCILLFNPKDIVLQRFLIENSLEDDIRRKKEFEKLQMMADFANAHTCLLKYIVNYFGEDSENCGKCSNCENTNERIDVTEDAQKIISCVARMKQRYGKGTVVSVLVGSKNSRILNMGLNKLSTYGLFKNKDYVDYVINFLISEQVLKIEIENSYPILKLEEKSSEVLKNEYPILIKSFKESTKEVSKTITKNTKDLNENQKPLFEKLKFLRKEIAKEEKVPPFIVFSDASLIHMCNVMPKNLEEFKEIHGVGKVKIQAFGERFLKVINE